MREGWNQSKAKSTELPSDSFNSRVDLNPKDFNDLIIQKGCRVKVSRSMFCPNVHSLDGAEHDIECEMCNGSGFVDKFPIETIAFLQNQTLEQMHQVEGFVDGNTVAGTFQSTIELQYFALVELLDYSQIYYERIAKSEGQIDVLKYPAKLVNVITDQNNKDYYQGSDFKIDTNGSISWVDQKGPVPGTIFSVHYQANIEYRCVQALHVNRFTQLRQAGNVVQHVKLPTQWLLKRSFLVKRRDYNGNELDENSISDYNDKNDELV